MTIVDDELGRHSWGLNGYNSGYWIWISDLSPHGSHYRSKRSLRLWESLCHQGPWTSPHRDGYWVGQLRMIGMLEYWSILGIPMRKKNLLRMTLAQHLPTISCISHSRMAVWESWSQIQMGNNFRVRRYFGDELRLGYYLYERLECSKLHRHVGYSEAHIIRR